MIHITTLKTIKTCFLFFSFLILVVSCKKKDEIPEVIFPEMHFNVNGTVKNIDGPEHVFANKADGGKTIVITARLNASNETVVLTIRDVKGKGDYPVEMSAGAIYTNGSNPATELYTATTGMITVSTFQENGLKGSFNFKSYNTGGFHKTITNGSFEAFFSN